MNTQFDPEKLMLGITATLAQADVERVNANLWRLRLKVGTPTAPVYIEDYIRDAAAAFETYNRRLHEAEIAAGWASE